jgi:hypothetical protein
MEAGRLADTAPEAFQLSLRIRHPSMDPAEISHALGLKPEHSFRAGGARVSSSGVSSVYSESYWLGVLPLLHLAEIRNLLLPEEGWMKMTQRQVAVAARSLGWALSLSCARFLVGHAEVLRRIRSEGGEVTLLVTVASGEVPSFTLAPDASRILGDLGVAVEFELNP